MHVCVYMCIFVPCVSLCVHVSLYLSIHLDVFSCMYKYAYIYICDRICENPACRENAQVAQCAFLVPRVENCQSPVFVIFMSKNHSTNYCRSLRRVNISYQGEITFTYRPLDLPSQCTCRTRSPLQRALIGIPARGLS